MFDELDDPAYAGPRPDARDAVLARAGRIRRTRRIAAAGGAGSVVLLVVGTAVGLGSVRTGGQTGIEPVATAPSTASAQESPTPTATPTSATPTPVRTSAVPTPTTAPEPPVIVGPTVRPSPERVPAYDHVSEWLGMRAIDSCRPATALPPRPGELERSGLSMTLEAPAAFDGTDAPAGRLVFTNNTDQRIWFSYLGSGGGPVHTIAAGNGAFSGETYTEQVGRENPGAGAMDLDAGETTSIEVTLLTDTCAQGRTLAKRNRPTPLAAGTYRISAGIMITEAMYWGPSPDASGSPSPSPSGFRPAVYSTVPVTVTIT